jgi:hypothetical protein
VVVEEKAREFLAAIFWLQTAIVDMDDVPMTID